MKKVSSIMLIVLLLSMANACVVIDLKNVKRNFNLEPKASSGLVVFSISRQTELGKAYQSIGHNVDVSSMFDIYIHFRNLKKNKKHAFEVPKIHLSKVDGKLCFPTAWKYSKKEIKIKDSTAFVYMENETSDIQLFSDENNGRFINVIEFPAGSYEIYKYSGDTKKHSIAGEYFRFSSKDPNIKFDLRPGEIVYIGNIDFGFKFEMGNTGTKITNNDLNDIDIEMFKYMYPQFASSKITVNTASLPLKEIQKQVLKSLEDIRKALKKKK